MTRPAGWVGDPANQNHDTERARRVNRAHGDTKAREAAYLISQGYRRSAMCAPMRLSLRSVDRYIRRARDMGLLDHDQEIAV